MRDNPHLDCTIHIGEAVCISNHHLLSATCEDKASESRCHGKELQWRAKEDSAAWGQNDSLPGNLCTTLAFEVIALLE